MPPALAVQCPACGRVRHVNALLYVVEPGVPNGWHPEPGVDVAGVHLRLRVQAPGEELHVVRLEAFPCPCGGRVQVDWSGVAGALWRRQ